MKYGYKEVRKLGKYDLIELCLRRGWLNDCTDEEYDNLMKMTDRDNITTDDIVEIATVVIELTANMNEYFCEVCEQIARKCYTRFEVV